MVNVKILEDKQTHNWTEGQTDRPKSICTFISVNVKVFADKQTHNWTEGQTDRPKPLCP